MKAVRRTPRWALCAAAALAGAPAAGAAGTAEQVGQRELLRAVNQARAQHGLAPLRRSALLSRPARRHSAYVARTGRLTHLGADGRPFWERLYRAGYPRTRAVGENVGIVGGCNARAARQIVGMWMASGPHRALLLSRSFRVVGLGVVRDARCRNTGYTADFGG
jgi:uncharacterized protein YkwD